MLGTNPPGAPLAAGVSIRFDDSALHTHSLEVRCRQVASPPRCSRENIMLPGGGDAQTDGAG
jgi:hypothetical protein